MKRKEFQKAFLPYVEKGKQIWVVTKITDLPDEIVALAIKLAELDFIHNIRISDGAISISSEKFSKKPSFRVLRLNYHTKIGAVIPYRVDYKWINIFELISPDKETETKIAEAILEDFPNDWALHVFMDGGNAFWKKMKRKYKNIDWLEED